MSGAELRHVMCGLGEKMSAAEINVLIEGLEDLHGNIKYVDFIKKLMSDGEDWQNEA